MNVVLISEHASPLAGAGGVDAGGQNVYVEHVARRLAAAGHRVDVLTRRDARELPRQVEMAPRLRLHHVDAGPADFVPKEALLPHMPAFARAAGQLQAVQAADVVHANFFMSGWVGLALQRRLRVPLVTTFHALGLVRREHQGSADTFPPARIAIERTLVRRSERLIAECPQDRDDLERLYHADNERIACVPCGVDTAAFRPGDRAAARRRLGLDPHEFIVLQLGRLVPRKGIATVIEAMARLPSALPARLVVVGGDARTPDAVRTPEIARLRALAGQCGVAGRVQFVGRRERHELRDWYVAADVFATTPWYEPFGITPLEAMACATPVIGSAVGGIRHTVLDGRTGFLVPPHDPAALAARIVALHADPALARALGAAGVRRVRSGFTWDFVATELASLYAGLLKQRRHALQRAPLARSAARLAS
ncbi:glycosyl transferase family 1 [Rubrivivax gelatinosus]|nr:glycosyl transferase family 1 [Rubrivivax gelatinosus]